MLSSDTGTDLVTWVVCAIVAYLLGTLPTAYLAVRWVKGKDIRGLGDGNAGAANAARALGTGPGMAIGAVDIGKGLAAVLLARWLFNSLATEMIAGVFVIVGHIWPVFLQGRGGRGAATAVGVLLAIVPLVAVPMVVPALAVLYFFKSSTKALATLYIPLPFLAIWPAGYSLTLVAYALAVPVMVGISHYLSLRRVPTQVS